MSRKKKNSSKRKRVTRRSICAEQLEIRQYLAADLSPIELENLATVEVRSIDGSGNIREPDWGSTGIQLLRNTTAEYGDGISSLAGEDSTQCAERSAMRWQRKKDRSSMIDF